MRRRAPTVSVLCAALATIIAPTIAPATGRPDPAAPAIESRDGGCSGSPLDPGARYPRYVSEPAGTESAYCLFYGPYVIPGGHDLSRVDFDISLTDGFIVAGGPSVVYVDGTEPAHQEMHIHHSHWWFIDPEDRDSDPLPWMRWISGSGEEVTRGDFRTVADADPSGPRYGLFIAQGDRVAMINMLHNKTPHPKVVWIKVDIAFVHGTAGEIAAAPGPYNGKEFRTLTGVLHGSEFDVPRGGGAAGRYTYPHDLESGDPNWPPAEGMSPDVGHVWTAPFAGTIVIGAGHLHPGGKRVVVTNLGSPSSPCADDRGDGIPGTTLYELDLLDRTAGASFTEDFQIEITTPGFRATVREGDRIALNGIYESAEHGWWDAMSFTGFYIDEAAVPGPTDACKVWLADAPSADPTQGMPNRAWEHEADQLCGAGLGGPCDRPTLEPAMDGPETDVITIAGFRYVPNEIAGAVGPPQVARGTQLRFVNADMAQYVRHTVTTCPAPCNGPYVGNYPLPDGVFDSEYLGWEPTTNGRQVPMATLDTTTLEPAVYTYFCRVHAWMRGSIEIV